VVSQGSSCVNRSRYSEESNYPEGEANTWAVTERRNVVEQNPASETGVTQTPENSTTPVDRPTSRMSWYWPQRGHCTITTGDAG